VDPGRFARDRRSGNPHALRRADAGWSRLGRRGVRITRSRRIRRAWRPGFRHSAASIRSDDAWAARLRLPRGDESLAAATSELDWVVATYWPPRRRRVGSTAAPDSFDAKGDVGAARKQLPGRGGCRVHHATVVHGNPWAL